MYSDYLIALYVIFYAVSLAFPVIAEPPLAFVSSFFLTFHWSVLLLNLIFLVLLKDVENEIGSDNYLSVYALSTIAGNLNFFFFGVFHPSTLTGATAGIMGLFGVFAARHPWTMSVAGYYPMPAIMVLAFFLLTLLFTGGYFELMPLIIGAAAGLLIEEKRNQAPAQQKRF